MTAATPRAPALWQSGADAVLYDPALLRELGTEIFDAAWWHAQGKIEGEALGRGAAWFVGEAGGWALRHYRRGGLIGRVNADRYLWTGVNNTRAFREWRLLRQLHELGLPVPRPVAAHVQRAGAISYRANLLTERIAQTRTLASLLRQRPLAAAQLRGLGTTLARFTAAGVAHADLNANNVLCRESGDALDFFVIDFDRGRLDAPRWLCERALPRLQRSLEKIGRRAPTLHFSPSDWQALAAAYASAARG